MDAEFVLRSGVRSGLKRSSPSQSPPRPPSPPPEAAPAPPPPSSPPHPLRPSSPLPPPNSPRAGPPSARAPGIPTAIPALSRPDPLEQPPAALPPDPPLQKPPAEETPAPPGPLTTPHNGKFASLCDLCLKSKRAWNSTRLHEFGKKKFSARTVLLCDQCGREYHVGCLKEHGMADLTALPEGAWYCSMDCVKIWEALKDLVSRGAEAVPAADADLIKKKREEKGLNEEGDLDVRWRVLRDKSSEDSKLVLSKAVAIFHESFDPIIQATTGRDLIPAMVYGRSVRDQDYTGMYCAVLTVGKTVVSAGLFRVIGIEAAELPLVATSRDNQGLGYFQALFSCIERLLASLGVKHFVLPAADEAVSIWTQRFGFAKITQDELLERLKGGRTTVFHGTSTLHKLVLGTVPEDS
ncbi:hypothetical protein ACQ4PT_054586 [Festuca glaucescens]